MGENHSDYACSTHDRGNWGTLLRTATVEA